jgi:HK97 gp10 family phage protein
MAERVQITGLKEVLKKMDGLTGDLKRKSLLAGSRAGANRFKRAVLSKTPVKSGALKRSIGVRQMSKRLPDIVGAMVVIRTAGARTKKQRTSGDKDAFYWRFIEYGWYAGGRWRKGLGKKTRRGYDGEKLDANKGLTREGFRAKTRREKKKIKGKFFIKKSFDSKKEDVKRNYIKAIVKGIEKYGG